MTELVPYSGGNPLADLERARAMLEESRSLAEVKEIRDRAVAIKEYARAKKLGAEMVGYAQEIINRAERRAGQLISELPPEYPGRASPGTPKDVNTLGPGSRVFTPKHPNPPAGQPTTRQKLGYDISKRSQRIAAVPDHIFEKHVGKPASRLLRCAREDQLAERRAGEVAPVTVLDDIDIRHCSITDLDVEPGSVSLIIADPPYLEPERYSDLGAFAAKALKPGCPLLAYTGELILPDLTQRLGENLEWVWSLKIIWDGANNKIYTLQLVQVVKLVLVYSNGPYEPKSWIRDAIRSVGSGSKEHHEWEQFLEPVKQMIEMFTEPGDLVVDPSSAAGLPLSPARSWGAGSLAVTLMLAQLPPHESAPPGLGLVEFISGSSDHRYVSRPASRTGLSVLADDLVMARPGGVLSPSPHALCGG